MKRLKNIFKFLNLLINDNYHQHHNQIKQFVIIVKNQIFFKSGYYYCNHCFYSQGHVVGYYDKSDYDRTNFYQKSIYQRKYHFQNKIEKANKTFNLNLTADNKHEF